jgi:tetratricopeptide (TPR) repeat protein
MLLRILFFFLMMLFYSCGTNSEEQVLESQQYYKQGKIKLDEENYYGSIMDFDKSIGLDSNNSEAYFHRAQAKEGMNDLAGMFEDLESSIKINPSNLDAYYIRGSKRFLNKEYSLAIQDMQKCIELDPNELDNLHSQFIEITAKAQFKLKNITDALKNYNLLILKYPENASRYFSGRAEIKWELNDIEGAITDYSSSLNSSPTSEAYMNRATLFLMIGRIENACSDFENAGALGEPKAYEILAEYCN